jgi:hypothetical protein
MRRPSAPLLFWLVRSGLPDDGEGGQGNPEELKAEEDALVEQLNVTLTPAGRDYARAITDVIEELNREIARRVSPDQLAAAGARLIPLGGPWLSLGALVVRNYVPYIPFISLWGVQERPQAGSRHRQVRVCPAVAPGADVPGDAQPPGAFRAGHHTRRSRRSPPDAGHRATRGT